MMPHVELIYAADKIYVFFLWGECIKQFYVLVFFCVFGRDEEMVYNVFRERVFEPLFNCWRSLMHHFDIAEENDELHVGGVRYELGCHVPDDIFHVVDFGQFYDLTVKDLDNFWIVEILTCSKSSFFQICLNIIGAIAIVWLFEKTVLDRVVYRVREAHDS